jgi:dienelactone hydrolase
MDATLPKAVLEPFEADSFTHGGTTRDLYRRGTGPAVIVMAEMPGITPKVAAFAERVADTGCTAVMPHLFGVPGQDPVAGGRWPAMRRGLQAIVPACVSREFVVFATGRTSPVVDWLRALAVHEHERCGGPGVGVVGMCFTGGFGLAMATDPRVLVPVLSQPSLPISAGRKRARRSIDCSPADLDIVAGRCAAGELEVIGLRFRGDSFVPAERFEFLRERLGDAFIAVELDDDTANPDGIMSPHSVLTEHLIDRPGEATHDALQLVLDHFRRRLLSGGGSPAG